MESGLSFRSYVVLMSGATLAAWATWLAVLFGINPFEAGYIGLALFYITIFTALAGTTALLDTLYRIVLRKRHGVLLREVRTAFRHGVMLSFMAVFCLALSAQNLFAWWNVILLVLIIGGVEYFVISTEEARRL